LIRTGAAAGETPRGSPGLRPPLHRNASARSVYDVRRAFSSRRGDRTLKGTPWRSVKTVATGTRADARAALRELAAPRDLGLWSSGPYGIERAWVRRFPEQQIYLMTEHFYAISQTGAEDKKRPGFEKKWHEFTSPRLVAANAS
jgi:hypothetical protein